MKAYEIKVIHSDAMDFVFATNKKQAKMIAQHNNGVFEDLDDLSPHDSLIITHVEELDDRNDLSKLQIATWLIKHRNWWIYSQELDKFIDADNVDCHQNILEEELRKRENHV